MRTVYPSAAAALAAAEQLAQTGKRSKVGRDPGQPWHVITE